MNDYPIREIEINGERRKCLFSLFLWQRLEEEGLSVGMRTAGGNNKLAELSATADLVTIVYGALRNAIHYGIEKPYDLRFIDVDIWATTHRSEFAETITFALQTLIPPKAKDAPAAPQDDEVGKKKTSRSMWAKLRDFWWGIAG